MGLLRLSPDQALFARRGFHVGPRLIRLHLEAVGRAFIHGFNASVEVGAADGLGAPVAAVPLELRGFAFEGASMGLAILDLLTPWRGQRLARFLDGDARPHAYMAHVGAGWAFARLRRSAERALARFDPLLRWLVLDGYGFHQGYFAPRRWIADAKSPAVTIAYARRAFDQGLGRSLWFYTCADPARLATAVARFSPERQGDLWSGIGLACAYAGGVAPSVIAAIGVAAKPHGPQLAQGSAFAAKARDRAGNPATHTDLACQIFCGASAKDAARVTDDALANLPGDGADPAYEVWRRRIAAHFPYIAPLRRRPLQRANAPSS